MPTQIAYTPAEWALLLGAPALTALVLIHAAPCSPRLADRKLSLAIAAMTEPVRQGATSELIQAVMDTVRAGPAARWPAAYPRDLGEVGQWALAGCRQVAALLAQKAPEAEAEAYARWLISIGKQVALVHEHHPRQGYSSETHNERQHLALEVLAAAFDMSISTT